MTLPGAKARLAATRQLLAALWEFVRDSTPERLRQRYGDADYDWEHRVNTTSAAVGWRDRLLGVFHSPYQPTESALFHEMLDALSQQSHSDFHDFVFIDLGSGKGRTLLMASDYPFRRIVGVELLPRCIRRLRRTSNNIEANRRSALRWSRSAATRLNSLFLTSRRCSISSTHFQNRG